MIPNSSKFEAFPNNKRKIDDANAKTTIYNHWIESVSPIVALLCVHVGNNCNVNLNISNNIIFMTKFKNYLFTRLFSSTSSHK